MKKGTSGFTIVELLIVIVVIAILAAISVVAYDGIQNRANDTAVQTDIRNFANKVMEFNAINGRNPAGSGSQTAVEGIPSFKLARDSYATNVHNFYYCEAAGKFAVGAVSKSGNRYYYSSDQGLGTYSGSWGGGSTNCPGMGIASGYTFTYTYYLNNGTWASWSM